VTARALRIVHVDTERGWRGGERQAFWLAERLVRLGHRSIMAVRPDEPLARKAEEAKLPIVPLSPFAEMDILAAMTLRRAIINEEVDIVLAHSCDALEILFLFIMGTRCCIVMTWWVSVRLYR
jgi:hypothetical protein